MAMSSEQLTFFAEAYLASHTVLPGSRLAQQMTVTSGQRLTELSQLWGHEWLWLRTLLVSSAWHLTRCLLTWKHKVTPAGRSYYLLRVSMPRTGEIASGLLQSPMPSDVLGGRTTKGRLRPNETGIRKQAMAPTPRPCTGDCSSGMNRTELYEWMDENGGRLLPTPVANDDKSPEAHMAMKQRMKGGPRHAITSLQVTVKVDHPGGKLNPDWVSRMMGLPDGYLDV